jgi:acyl dehydratase
MSKVFEDFKIGEKFVTRARSLTEADIMQYAGLCWDTQAEHTNAEFARRGPFGERIGQQQLGLLIAFGLIGTLRIFDETLTSLLRLGWNFFNPLRIGDTLKVELTTQEKKELVGEPAGLIKFQWETTNQRNEVVHRCAFSALVARRTEDGAGFKPWYEFRGLSDVEPVATDAALPSESDVQQRNQKREAEPGRAGKSRRGKYFEEFEVGEELLTDGRTVAEADVVNYTILSWDNNPLHTDATYGNALGFAGTLAPLLLPIVFANGLGATLGFLAGTNRGALGDWWEFISPLRIGDTLHFRQVIAEKRDAQDPATGIVTFGMEMINERGQTISRGQRAALVARLPQNDGDAQPWNFVFGTSEDLARK